MTLKQYKMSKLQAEFQNAFSPPNPMDEIAAATRRSPRRPVSFTPSISYGVDWSPNLSSVSINKKRGSWTGPIEVSCFSGIVRTTEGYTANPKRVNIVEKAALQIDTPGANSFSGGAINDLNNATLRNRKSSIATSITGEPISLWQLAREGDYQTVLKVLDVLGPNARNQLNRLNEERLAPLHYAVRYNNTKVVQLLVERGAIVHIRGEDGLTPLHYAAKYSFSKKTRFKSEIEEFNYTEVEEKRKLSLEEHLLVGDVVLRKKPLKKFLSPKTGHYLNRKVRKFGKPLQKFKHKKYMNEMPSENLMWGGSNGVILTGSSNTLNSDDNNSSSNDEEDVIRYLVSQMAEVNSKDDFNLTPLHYTAIRNNYSAALSLLQCPGINLEARDTEDMTPLHLAVIHNNEKIVKLLIRAGAQLRCRDEHLATPLHHAALEGSLEIMEMLVTAAEEKENWKTVNEMTNDKDCEHALALHGAVDNGHFLCVEYLVTKGANVNVPNRNGFYPLHLAARNGDVDIVRLLLNNNNKNVDCKENDGETPLHEAAKYNHVMVMDILIQHGADIEAKDNNGFTPLLKSAYHGHVEAINSLLSLNADLQAIDNDEKTAIYWATAQNKHDALMALLDKSPRSLDLVTSTDRYGNSPLHVATLKGYAVITQSLLDLGAPTDLRNDMEQTPLHLAAWHGRTKIVNELIWRNKSAINLTDEDGNTALHIAATVGHESVVKLFIEVGANLELRNSRLWNPLDCAAARGSVSTVKLLLDSGCLTDPQERTRTTPLHLAAENGNIEVVKLLLQHGADTTRRDDQMRNSLEIAIDNTKRDIARAIIQSNQWEKTLRCRTFNDYGLMKTPLRKLILHMPDVAEEVFHRCTSNNGFPTDHPLYTVSFNYEFIDDTFNHFQVGEGDEKPNLKVDDEKNSIASRIKPTGEMLKYNHPLMIMVNSKRVHLLTHPLCVSLLHLKWTHFGRYVYYTNFVFYVLFLFFLTSYILTAVPPGSSYNSTTETLIININASFYYDNCDTGTEQDLVEEAVFAATGRFAVIGLATLHLIKEAFQLVLMRWSYFGLENLTELACFISSLLVMINVSECSEITGIRERWQWQAGTIAIFLAWVNLVMFFSKFPYLGLYVVMFGDVLRTFCKVCVISFLFIVAFSMAFYTVLYYNPSYANGAIAIIRVVVMMLGEFQFDDIFQVSTLVYPELSIFLFFIFLILVCLITMNLLVGLAVDDIKSVQAQASLKRLAMQVELVLNVESIMPKFLQERFVIRECSFMPNRRKEKTFSRFMEVVNNTAALTEALVSPEKYREQTSGVYRCKKSEISKVLEQQEMLYDFNKELKNTMNVLQNENKRLQELMVTLLSQNGVQIDDESQP